ncbi:MAG: bifunctional riboflavin kinase/FAD synthetase [Bacteroidetes bacterium]|jgi:riboflavin kinase/FMN adenylyltransferase|nr:bifunctional riboflavin kinase/FAD synthetase [Bacteroidota bacterium]
MIREYGLDQVSKDDRSVVTVGTFDGVHVGHQAILRYLQQRAETQAGQSVVVSFDPHPREVVHGEAVPLLTTIEERSDVMERLGIDRFIVIAFSEAFSKLDAEAFVEQVLVEQVGLKEIVIGYDHGFGRGREGDSDLLERLGARLGFAVDVIPPQAVDEHVVSSTEIRTRLVEEGDVTLAAEMLGRPYRLTGTVIEGDKRGRAIGFPTANLAVSHPRKVVPRRGVYAVRARGADLPVGQGGMMNIGQRPTFNSSGQHQEVHLFDYEGTLYGEELRIEFVKRIRDERQFDGIEALKEQLSRDRVRCKAALETLSSTV